MFNELIRSSVREAFWQMMSEEVESLCGQRYRPDAGTPYRRAGSEKGSVYLGGGKEEVRRPRVRHETEGEVRLESYRAASSQSGLFEQIVGLVGEGMSQRGVERATKGAASKSAVSRMWEAKSREQLATVRERPLDGAEWVAVMVDGVSLGGEHCVVVALGIDGGGRKQVLDFEAGEEAFEDLREFLSERNAGAALALCDRRDEILCVHRLGVPATLNVTLLNTNCIENVMRNWREHTNNIKRWSVKADMVERWSASGLLWAESGFRRIRHREDLPKLREALARPISDPASATAPSLRSAASAPAGSEIGTRP